MVPGGHSGRRNLWEKEWKGKLEVSTEWCQLEGFWRIKQKCFRGEGNHLYENCTLQEEYASWELDTGKKAKGGGKSGSWEVQERLEEGGPNSRGGVKQNLYLIGGRGEWGGGTCGCVALLFRRRLQKYLGASRSMYRRRRRPSCYTYRP